MTCSSDGCEAKAHTHTPIICSSCLNCISQSLFFTDQCNRNADQDLTPSLCAVGQDPAQALAWVPAPRPQRHSSTGSAFHLFFTRLPVSSSKDDLTPGNRIQICLLGARGTPVTTSTPTSNYCPSLALHTWNPSMSNFQVWKLSSAHSLDRTVQL